MKHVQSGALMTGADRSPSGGPRTRSGAKVVCAGAIALGLLVVGCGSSSPAPSSSGEGVATTAAQTLGPPAQGLVRIPARAAAVGKVVHRKANERYAPPRIVKGNPVQRPAPGTGGNTANDENPPSKASRADSGRPTTYGQPNPCMLVSAAQAQAITGKGVAVKEAPLGPTCIYQVSGVTVPITIAVERLSVSTLKPHIKKLSQLNVGGRTAYCGVYGAAVTYVPLSGGRVIHVSAPCAVGTKFAAAALPKLGY